MMKTSVDKELKVRVDAAATVITEAANAATKVIAEAAAEALKITNTKLDLYKTDHDILIELKTRMGDLKDDIKDLKDGTSAKIDNHDARIVALETSKTRQNVLMSIGIGLMSLLVSLVIYILTK